MRTHSGWLIPLVAIMATHAAQAQVVTSAFTYQGQITTDGVPAAGLHDLRFRIFDAPAGGLQVGPTLCADNVALDESGRFTVEPDFGAIFPGTSRYLELQVRADTGANCGDTRGFITLSPRTTLTATPYASHALGSGLAANATLLAGQPGTYYTNASNLASGTLADARLSGNISTLTGVQTFTGSKSFSTPPTFTAGGAPFIVLSNARVANLNADLLDGLDSTAFAPVVHVHDAAAIVSGTLTDARLGSNIARRNATNDFTDIQVITTTDLVPLVLRNTNESGLNVTIQNLTTGAGVWGITATGAASPLGVRKLLFRDILSDKTRIGIDSSGLVGIGTSSPLADLHVTNAVGNADLLIKREDAPQGFNFGVNTTPILFISRSDGASFTDILAINGSTDRVGIGTSAPEARLDIRGPAGDDPLRIRVDGSTKFRLYANGGASIGSNPASVPADGLYVHGSLGVGTTSPSSPLHAVSTANSGAVLRGESQALSGVSVGVYGSSTSISGVGLYGQTTSATGSAYGVIGQTASASGRGVYGLATSSSGSNFGVYGRSDSSNGNGVRGEASSVTGAASGVYGKTSSPSGTGVTGLVDSPTGSNFGLFGAVLSPDGMAVNGQNTATTGNSVGVRGYSDSVSGRAVFGIAFNSNGTNFGVYGISNSVAGFDFYAAGAGLNYGSASSRRWKSDIRPIDDPLGKIARLRGVYYTWDKEHGGHRDLGFIAEEVGAVLPEIVRFESNGTDAIGMDYAMMTPLLVEAVNALHAENQQLKTSNASLEHRLTLIENRLRELGLLDGAP